MDRETRRQAAPYSISAADGERPELCGPVGQVEEPRDRTARGVVHDHRPDANALTRPVQHRMPVLLDKAGFKAWLSDAAGAEILRPAAEDRVRMWPVSRRVNETGSGDDDPTLIDEVAA